MRTIHTVVDVMAMVLLFLAICTDSWFPVPFAIVLVAISLIFSLLPPKQRTRGTLVLNEDGVQLFMDEPADQLLKEETVAIEVKAEL